MSAKLPFLSDAEEIRRSAAEARKMTHAQRLAAYEDLVIAESLTVQDPEVRARAPALYEREKDEVMQRIKAAFRYVRERSAGK